MRRGVAGLNETLIGARGGRTKLETPALVLDADAFEANLQALTGLARAAGLALRPHAKSHKCATIARRQMEAGALGIACAKTGELLALFEAGIDRLMLTAPVISRRKIDRLTEAVRRGAEITVTVDHPTQIADYAASALDAGVRLAVLVECDVGQHRTGVASPEAAVALAGQIAAEDSLVFAGVQGYAGFVQHIFDHEARRTENRLAMGRLLAIVEALDAAGLPPRIVTGGGTGSHMLDLEDKVLTEVQAGSYVFMDEDYRRVDLHGSGADVFGTALFVVVTVIAHNLHGDAIVDAGTKSFAVDGPLPRAYLDGHRIGTITFVGDEFGRLETAPGQPAPALGTRLECSVPHCDPTANLHDFLHVVRADRLEDIWPIEARGLSD
ncbi:MAG: DSD1 family PLP-dependent enzyme [Candidatus Kaistia colombiensis]|nr:MAG: DSD1 family PLP-dependent enzyme [Kaistia sp.]